MTMDKAERKTELTQELKRINDQFIEYKGRWDRHQIIVEAHWCKRVDKLTALLAALEVEDGQPDKGTD